MTRHRYCENFNFYQDTPGTPEYYLWGANNAYDPDHTGTGHQPMGFDQMAEVYGSYAVVGSKIHVRCVPVQIFLTSGTGTPATYTQLPFYCGIYLDDNDTPPYSLTMLREESGSVWTTTSMDGPKGVTCKYRAKTQYGPDWLDLSSAAPTASPPNGTFFTFWICCAELGGGHGTCNLEVTIEYIILWSDRKEMDPS